MNQFTPDLITELQDGEIFVFGSNVSGRHSKGAAKTALGWGAKFGQAAGLQGKTYGIPTVNASVTNKLSINKIKVYVDEFVEFAAKHPELTFLVTEIGCGLAGHGYKDIGPLFTEAAKLSNVILPKKFARTIKS
jgi:hypothetical protein